MIKQPKPNPITKTKLLAVEGKDEINFFEALFKCSPLHKRQHENL